MLLWNRRLAVANLAACLAILAGELADLWALRVGGIAAVLIILALAHLAYRRFSGSSEYALRRSDSDGGRARAPGNRAEAVRWARAQCRRIVDGEFDDQGPVALFGAAHRIEVILTQWEWTGDDYPPTILRFVEGWQASGAVTDTEIRAAARALLADPTGAGPPAEGSFHSSLVDADDIASR